MIITDEIRNYRPVGALPLEQHKTCDEYYTLAMLKYAFPDRFSKLHKAESPDLQDADSELGIEVTWGCSPTDKKIDGESYKYSQSKTDEERKRHLQEIRKSGGEQYGILTSYPTGTDEGAKACIMDAFRKKLKKIERYRENLQKLGVAIMMDIPLSILYDPNWGGRLLEIERGSESKYDFVALIHWKGVSLYDFQTQEYSHFAITEHERITLKKLARMTVEGIFTEDDPVWN